LYATREQAVKCSVREIAIAVDHLEKSFPPARSGWRALLQPFEKATSRALADVSFEVREGEALGLLGANGAGKSTLLRIIATLLLPTRGAARVAGFNTASESREVRRRLGYHAGSDSGFYARLTGRQNLSFFGRLNQLPPSETTRRITELAQQFRIQESLDRQVRTLSTGTVQRLSLVRALLHRPPVLLLDEPTRSLDAIGALEFRRFLKSEILRGGGTCVLFASHTLAEIETLADRVVIIDSGKVLACGTAVELKRQTGTTNLEEVFLRLTGFRSPAESTDPESRPE
jgi:ABC-type multidrug transport system ATPase subunit